MVHSLLVILSLYNIFVLIAYHKRSWRAAIALSTRGEECKVLCSPGGDTHNTQTERVDTEVARIIEAVRRAANTRTVVP